MNIRFPARLHVRGASIDDKTIEPAYVAFSLDADGHVARVTMKAVSPLADFSYDYQDLVFAAGARGTE